MGPLEADRHRRSPLLYTLDHRQRPYHKSPQMQICDKTAQPGLALTLIGIELEN